MANTVLTAQTISNELLMRFENSLGFTAGVSHEYDNRFGIKGAKIGDSIAIRKPVRFLAVDGPDITSQIQDVVEESVTLRLDTYKTVPFSFSSTDLTLKIDDFGDRYLKSAAVSLANSVDVAGLTMAYQSTYNTVGTPGTTPADTEIYYSAGEKLDNNSTPIDDERRMVINPRMQTKILKTNQGLFNSQPEIKRQYEKGRMGTFAGFDWKLDQNVRSHTIGAWVGTPAVNGASQVGASLVTNGWTGSVTGLLKKGDVFTIAGVYAVNPVSGDILADLQQFVVTADVNSTTGAATLPISPSIITSGPRKTVSAGPAAGALITVFGAANTITPQGIAYHKEAFAFGMAPLVMPQGVHFAARSIDSQTGMSIRIVSQYDIKTDVFITRADILFGWVARNERWAVRIAA